MKVIVIIRFKDKYTNLWHPVNEVLTISKKWYEEIKKFVKLDDEEKTSENFHGES